MASAMAPLYLTEDDVRQLLDMPRSVERIEEAFCQTAGGTVDNVPRTRCRTPGVMLHSMSAACGYLNLVGWKQYTTTAAGARFLVGLHDGTSGELLALIEADRLGQLRTGAATGVAVRHMTPEGIARVAIIGSGSQAQSQLAAVCAVRPIRQAVVYSRDPQRRSQFAVTMAERLGVEVMAAGSVTEAIKTMPLVITATTSRTPVFDGSELQEGTVVCAMGSNSTNRAEIDAATVRRATTIVCDDVACCQNEAGDLCQAASRGEFNWANALALADVVEGKVDATTLSSGIGLFKSVGMAMQDVALGGELLKLARQKQVGTVLSEFTP